MEGEVRVTLLERLGEDEEGTHGRVLAHVGGYVVGNAADVHLLSLGLLLPLVTLGASR